MTSFTTESGIKVRPLKNKRDRKALLRLVKTLPEWFDAEDHREMSEDLIDDPGLVAEMDGQRVGFVTWFKPACKPAPHRTELTWLAVHRNVHGKGVGKALIQGLEQTLLKQESGPVELMVWTMAESAPIPEYAATRAFYHKCQFEDWFVDTENPEQWGGERLFLRKTLRGQES